MSKTILITGSSSGFGRDTAETLARAGHTVYASMRGVHGKNRATAEALQKLGIKTVDLDVNDDASVAAGVKNVLSEAGKIDVLVNNAGIADIGRVGFRIGCDLKEVGAEVHPLMPTSLLTDLQLTHRSARSNSCAAIYQHQEIHYACNRT
jgi:NAD(P)-dependent dehydrogenase (short-subunit alcohol dehydrogenase family)